MTVVTVLNVRVRATGAGGDAVSDVLALETDCIKPAPEINASTDSGCIMGIACIKSGDVQRMLILVGIEALMSGAEMGLMKPALH